MNQYEDITDDLHTDLHECLGHGSGQLLPGTDPDALKAYGSTIEEARADLFGLYYVADHKLVELGLTPNDEAYKAQYYGYLMNGLLTQTIRIKEGDKIKVKLMEIDPKTGKYKLSHRVLMEKPEGYVERERRPRPERGERRGRRDERHEGRGERPARQPRRYEHRNDEQAPKGVQRLFGSQQ